MPVRIRSVRKPLRAKTFLSSGAGIRTPDTRIMIAGLVLGGGSVKCRLVENVGKTRGLVLCRLSAGWGLGNGFGNT